MVKRPQKWLLFSLGLIIAYRATYHIITKEIFIHELKHAAQYENSCGLVKENTNPKEAIKCAKSRIQKNERFYVSFDLIGIDSHISIGLASNGDDGLKKIVYDSNPEGFCFVFCLPRIEQSLCVSPVLSSKNYGMELDFWSVNVQCKNAS